jgi:hypothetical protein
LKATRSQKQRGAGAGGADGWNHGFVQPHAVKVIVPQETPPEVYPAVVALAMVVQAALQAADPVVTTSNGPPLKYPPATSTVVG